VAKEVSLFAFVIDFGATGLAVRERGDADSDRVLITGGTRHYRNQIIWAALVCFVKIRPGVWSHCCGSPGWTLREKERRKIVWN